MRYLANCYDISRDPINHFQWLRLTNENEIRFEIIRDYLQGR